MYFSKTSVFNSILPHEIFSIKANCTLKILGIIFDSKLNFEERFNLVVKRASQGLHFLRVLQRILPPDELWKICNSLIRSIFEYA